MLTTIINAASGLFSLLGLLYSLRPATANQARAGAVALFTAGAAQFIHAATLWVDGTNGQFFAAAVWASVALGGGALAWGRADDMEPANGDTEGDLR